MHKFILFWLLPLTLVSARLPVRDTYTLTKEYTVIILGTSNVKNWKDSIGVVTGEMVADLNEDASVDLHSIHIKMEVRSIKSNIGNALDNKTYRALKADANPAILFNLDAPVRLMQTDPGQKPISIKGHLTLAGVSRPVLMQVDGLKLENGNLRFEGSQTIDMTDYGIRPPTVFLGTIKARPRITIIFKTNFTNKINEL